MRQFLAIFFILIISSISFGGNIVSSLDDVTEGDIYFEDLDKIDLKVDAKSNFYITYGDRELVMKENIETAMPLSANILLKEYACHEDLTNVNCKIEVPAIFKNLSLFWSKHSDSSKVNKQAILKTEFEEKPLFEIEESIDWFDKYDKFSSEKFFYSLSKKTSPPVISCENKNWLKYIFGDKKDVTISEWTAEEMLENRELKIDMNQVFSSAMNVKASVSGEKITINSIGFVPDIGEFSLLSLNFGWATEKNGSLCDSSFSLDPTNENFNVEEFKRKLNYKKFKWDNSYLSQIDRFDQARFNLDELSFTANYQGEIPEKILNLVKFGFYQVGISEAKMEGKDFKYYVFKVGELK